MSTDGKDHSAKTEVEIDRLSNFDKRLFYIKIDFERAFQKKSLTRLYQKHVWMGMDLWRQT